jgi:hypothetical protein
MKPEACFICGGSSNFRTGPTTQYLFNIGEMNVVKVLASLFLSCINRFLSLYHKFVNFKLSLKTTSILLWCITGTLQSIYPFLCLTLIEQFHKIGQCWLNYVPPDIGPWSAVVQNRIRKVGCSGFFIKLKWLFIIIGLCPSYCLFFLLIILLSW